MEEFVFIAALAPVVAIGILRMQRLGPSGASLLWCFAWVCLWISGLLSSIADPPGSMPWAATLCGGLFAGFLLAGTCALLELPRRWGSLAIASGLGLGLLSVGLRLAGSETAAIVASRAESSLFFVAAALLWRNHRHAKAPVRSDRVLAAAVAAVGGLHFASPALPILGISGVAELAVWAGLCLSVALAQILCFMDRSRIAEGRASRAFAAERATLHSLFESVPAGLLLIRPDGQIAVHNRTAAEFAGYPVDQSLVGVDIEAYAEVAARQLPSIDQDTGLAAVREMGWDPGERSELEFRLVGPPERWITLTVREVRSATGDDLGRLWVFFDRTESKQLDERLARATRMEALAKAIGGIAHDFNNQLTTILGNTTLLLEGLEHDDSRLESLRDIEDAVRHSAEITRGLLDFSRQRTGPMRPVSLERELDAASTMVSLPDEVAFESVLPQGLPCLRADAPQLRRVLANLIGNAADAVMATGRGGRIRVEAAVGSDETVVVKVTDDGIGMEPRTLESIFHPFFTTKGHRGTGLGMAIVHGIVTAHEARVEVESEPGRGSCVTLRWPATPESAIREPGDYGQASALAGRNRIVLLVEDNEAVRRLGRRILNQQGFQVLATETGEEAIELARESDLDLSIAILDFDLPGCDGIETLHELRRLRPGLPAMIVSGRLADEKKAGLPAGVPVLMKPYRPSELAPAVRAALDGPGS